MSQESPQGSGRLAPERWPRAWPLLLFVTFAAIDLVVLRGGLHGPFVSDDIGYILVNPYLRQLNLANLAAFFDPGSQAQIYAVGNYSPVHLLLHALEWQIFADEVFGYHLVNVLVHAGVSVLLVALLLRSGVPRTAALLGGAFFTLHPANVQAVIWISQLKSTAGLGFALAALLALRRHPGLATLLFALGLLTKASAVLALPAAAAFTWVRGSDRRQWAVIGLWTALFAGFAAVEFAEFARRGWVEPAVASEPLTRLRSVAGYAARYLAMATTSWGVSAYQEPDPVTSSVDPWFLAALPLGALLVARLGRTLWRREEEGAWWLMAAVAWAPVSQVFPFVFPMADHYLYFMLPGLIGGVLLLGARFAPRFPRGAGRALAAAALGVIVFFGWHSAQRARLWQVPMRLEVDAVRKYPNGRIAHQHRARRAARDGDVERVVAELEGAHARGMYDFEFLLEDPAFAALRSDPRFQAVISAWAGIRIERLRASETLTASELRVLAAAHVARGERAEARDALERALARGGPDAEATRRALAALEATPAEAGSGPAAP